MVGFKNYRIFYKIHVEEQVFSEGPYIKQTYANVCTRIRTHYRTNPLYTIMHLLQNKTHYTYAVVI